MEARHSHAYECIDAPDRRTRRIIHSARDSRLCSKRIDQNVSTDSGSVRNLRVLCCGAGRLQHLLVATDIRIDTWSEVEELTCRLTTGSHRASWTCCSSWTGRARISSWTGRARISWAPSGGNKRESERFFY